MREILFKGKRLDNGEWVYWDCFGRFKTASGKGYKMEVRKDSSVSIYHLVSQRPDLIDKNTISRCTGLRSKNKKLIWEGDVVTIPGSNKMGLPAPVEYRKLGATFLVARKGFTAMNLWDADEIYEVIGNKWDNPELLGEDA